MPQIHPQDKQYQYYDLQDETDCYTGTMRDVKEWLIDFWSWTDIHEDSDLYCEHRLNRFLLDIQKATESELHNMLSGIDWAMDEVI